MNVVDSNGWLEYFSDGENADFFAPVIEKTEKLIIPTMSLYEVFKVITRERDEHVALQAVALMKQGRVVSLDDTIAIAAARFSLQYKLPMVDSMMYASALHYKATFWTQDKDFQNISGVKFIQKR